MLKPDCKHKKPESHRLITRQQYVLYLKRVCDRVTLRCLVKCAAWICKEGKCAARRPCGDLRGKHMTDSNLLCSSSPTSSPPPPSVFPLSPIGCCRKGLVFSPTCSLEETESLNLCWTSHGGFWHTVASKSSIRAAAYRQTEVVDLDGGNGSAINKTSASEVRSAPALRPSQNHWGCVVKGESGLVRSCLSFNQ